MKKLLLVIALLVLTAFGAILGWVISSVVRLPDPETDY